MGQPLYPCLLRHRIVAWRTVHSTPPFLRWPLQTTVSCFAALHDLEDINNQMSEKGIGRIPETVLHARFIRALPDEYSLVKETLQSMKNRDRDEIIRMISTRYSTLPQKKGAQRSSRQPEHTFVSSKSGDRSGARRGRGRRNGGGQSRGRGQVNLSSPVERV